MSQKIIITENVKVEDLDDYDVIVSDTSDDEYVSISAPIETSFAVPGTIRVETDLGCLYLDPEFPVRAGKFVENEDDDDYSCTITTIEASGSHAIVEMHVSGLLVLVGNDKPSYDNVFDDMVRGYIRTVALKWFNGIFADELTDKAIDTEWAIMVKDLEFDTTNDTAHVVVHVVAPK